MSSQFNLTLLFLAVCFFARGEQSPTAVNPAAAHPLVWGSPSQDYAAKSGEKRHAFSFSVTNTAAHEVVITEILPSCGCTVAPLPVSPWRLAAGAQGSVSATMDLTGRFGLIAKSLEVRSSAGPQTLSIRVNLPVPEAPSSATVSSVENSDRAEKKPVLAHSSPDAVTRERNQLIAQTNRQAVFIGQCAECHAKPASAKLGAPLYRAACAICHDSPHRASMVPDLAVPRQPRDAAFWRTRIADGVPDTLMPAFAHRHGGPLSEEQIQSLVDWLLRESTTLQER